MLLLALLLLASLAVAVGSEWLRRRIARGRFSFRSLFRSAGFVPRLLFFLLFPPLALTALCCDFTACLHMTAFRLAVGLIVLLVLAAAELLRVLARTHFQLYLVCSLMLSLLLAAAAEGVFSFRAIQSHGYEPTELTPYLASASGYQTYDAESGVYTGSTNGQITLTYRGLGLEIKNLYISAGAAKADGAPLGVRLTVRVTDKGNAKLYTLPVRTVYESDPYTRYIPLQTAGESDEISLTFQAKDGIVSVGDVRVNAPKPFRFEPLRFAAVFLLLFTVLAARPSSPMYAIEAKDRRLSQTAVTVSVVLLNFALAIAIVSSGTFFRELISYHQNQYQLLARQLSVGQVTYPATPPAFLLEMDNPYDSTLRAALSSQTGQYYVWDTSFFNGNYYVYFGVVPVVLLYLPFYLLTGRDLPNDIAVLVFAFVFLCAVFLLVRRIIRRHFPHTPFLLYLVLSLLLANGTGLFTLLIYPSLYSVPILAALAFSVLGLWFWYGALEREALSPWHLLLGSLCMALVAGCRPQLLLLSFLAIPLFFDAVVRRKTLLPTSRRGAVNFACFVLPYLLCAAGLMYYNAIRFGSPFDFGANYNLTTNDMTSRGFRVDRLGLAVFQYLLQLPRYCSTYPFIRAGDLDTVYMGVTIWEHTYGGLFAIAPFSLFALGYRRCRARLARRYLAAPVAILIGTGLLLPLVDAQMAGILLRYFADFSFPLLLGAALIFLTLYDSMPGRRRLLRGALLLSLGATCLHNLTLVLSSSYLSLPVSMMSALSFWF